MPAPFAAIHGPGFGLGATQLAPGESAMVLFLLGLLSGVLLMTLLFVYLSWKQSRFPSLPPETRALLDELARPDLPGPARSAPPAQPWEKPDDWWKAP